MTNTDDFLWRLVKGCIQLGLVPDINNTVNMVPVDHVARCCALAALCPLPGPQSALGVLHVAAAPRPTFNARGAEKAEGISTALLSYVCAAALHEGVRLLWLDRVCLMQNNKDDKS